MGKWSNLLLHGDCLAAIEKLRDELLGQIRVIYIDPPFFSGTDYTIKSKAGGSHQDAPSLKETKTYSDKWSGGLQEYLDFMRERLVAMKPLLREDGSLWVHLDWHVSHYVKVLLDEIYGYPSFINEIVWRRTNSPKAQSRGLGTQHDIILLYALNPSSFKARPVYREHDEKSLRPYSYNDERGRFRLIEIEAQGIQRSEGRKQFDWRGRTAPYLYSQDTLERWWEDGLIYKSKHGRFSKKQYLEDVPGILVSDLWLDIPPLQGSSKEYSGFSTQKPEELLKRVIYSASEEGDVVADFFVGSGTTAVVAAKTRRKWIGVDSSAAAIDLVRERLKKTLHEPIGPSCIEGLAYTFETIG
jgi:adenine-specific DNA-methyltransferase